MRTLTDFESRAAGVDAAVWAVLTQQAQNLPDPADIQAVLAGAVTSITRLVYHTLAEPGVTETVEAVRELSCHAATAVHQEALASARPPTTGA